MKRFYIAACILLFMALISDVVGKHYYSVAMCTRAKAAGHCTTVHEAVGQESDAVVVVGNWFNGAGILLALFGIIAWVGSMLKGNRERTQLPPFVPFTLAVVYVIVYMVCV